MDLQKTEPAAKKPPAEGEKIAGSISVYLMLVLVIVLVLICTLIESGRVSAVSLRARSLAYMGADSVFSEYARSIFEDYGIMVLWKDEDEFISEFNEYVEANLDTSDLSYSETASLYGISLTGSSLSSLTYITDESGLVFADQVYEYMDYYLAESAAQKLLEELDIFSQADTVSALMEKINSYSDVFTAVEEKAALVKEAVSEAQSIDLSPAGLLDELYETAQAYSEGESSASDFSKILSSLKKAKESISDALKEVESTSQEYYTSTQEAAQAAESLSQSLLEEADNLDEDIYESISSQLADLSEKSTDTEADYYKVSENLALTEDYLSKLDSLEELFESLSESISEENAADYTELISRYQTTFADFDLDNLSINLDTSAVESESTSILDYISNLIDKGVLAYIKEDISEKTIETDELPSVTASADSSDSEESLAAASVNKVIFGQYILDHFSNAADTYDDTALEYEAEYILAGKSSDLANLKVVTAQIVAIRSSLNFVSILQDSAKRNEAYTLATAMVGFTGMPVLISAVQILILTAWAMAEAVVDAKCLLDGQKVPTIKTSSEWCLSIEGFKNFTGKNIETVSYESGLEYEDYLRVLLAMQGRQKQYFRTMDMIQADVCLNENDSFRMDECISAVEIETCFYAPALFVSFAWVRSEIASYDGGYAFTLTQNYEY